MRHQHGVAVEKQYTFLKTPGQIHEYVDKGRLVTLAGNADYVLSKVSFPYARPEVRMFVEHIAADYRAATGGPLVVTSLTRPDALQPRNAHELSVHPAGMAVDFRVPDDAKSRQWLEAVLLALEKQALIDATRERHPPHYHVAVFPEPYLAYAKRRDAAAAVVAAARATSVAALAAPVPVDGGGHARLAFPLNPLIAGFASGLGLLALVALGGTLATVRRRRRKPLGRQL
jgi:acetylornithine deacetylase/succinyl-diaminopimelate desuccinylase-like protein